MSLRYLFGPVDRDFAERTLSSERQARNCLAFGWKEGPDLAVGADESWESVLARLPAGWQPDLIVLQWAFTHIPSGLWQAPVPIVGLARDWKLLGHHCRTCAPRCERILTDRAGVARLSALGFDHARYFQHSSYCGDGTTEGECEARRDIDILFVGNMQDAVQRERLPWAARLAALGERWNVVIRPPVSGKEYHQLLSRARIVWNRSNSGECNPRVFEAAGHGALLFQETENLEIDEFFERHQEFVPYSNTDLEVLLDYYLNHEPERRAIAEAARRKVLRYHSANLWNTALTKLAHDLPQLRDSMSRRLQPTPRDELLGRVWQAVSIPPIDSRLGHEIDTALSHAPTDSELHGARGIVAGVFASDDQTRAAAAIEHFRAAAKYAPDDVMAALNFAESLAAWGQTNEAVNECRRALQILDNLSALPVRIGRIPHFPSRFDFFRVEWEQAGWMIGEATREQAKRNLLAWRLHGLLARLTGSLAHRYEATLARPDLPATRAALASALVQEGKDAEAVNHLWRAIALNPFDRSAPRLLSEVLGRLARTFELEQLRQSRRLLSQAAPQLVPSEPWFAVEPVALQPVTSLHRPAPPTTPTRPRVSLCMIVRNEEADLPLCLGGVVGLVDEIVIVDTGSTDRTREIAREYGAKVVHFQWVDSFAAARNESVRHASGDWVFWLDADDRLDGTAREALRRLFADLGPQPGVYLMTTVMKHGVDASRVEHARLFRRDPAVQWDYRVHEQILPAAQRCGWPVRRTEICIRHEGYVDPSGLQAKLARNLRLLNLEYAERPQDPLVLFNLGSMQLELGHPEAAIELLKASVHFAPRGYSLYAKSHAFLIVAYRQLGRAAEALQVCRNARAKLPREPELLFYEGLLLQESGDPAAAERCFRELLQLPKPSAMSGHDQGLQGYKARHNIAVSLREQSRWSEAEAEWRAVLTEQPEFAPGWLALTQLLASQGRWEDLDREAMRAEAQPHTREMGELVRVKLLLLRGQSANAARMLEELKQHRPHAVWPRLLLAEALWQLADDPKAIEAALRDVLTLDPNHLPTRTRLIELAAKSQD